jgi:hypothetical protein
MAKPRVIQEELTNCTALGVVSLKMNDSFAVWIFFMYECRNVDMSILDNYFANHRDITSATYSVA